MCYSLGSNANRLSSVSSAGRGGDVGISAKCEYSLSVLTSVCVVNPCVASFIMKIHKLRRKKKNRNI